MKQYLPIVNKMISTLITGLALLLPIFFLPITPEFYEFNKLALTPGVTVAIIVLWGVKMLIEGKVEITKSPINLPLLLLVAAYGVSTYFSIDKYASIIGSYGRFSNSFFLITLLTLLYFAISANIKTRDEINSILKFFLVGGTISSLATVLAYFGLKFGNAPFLQIRNFTLTGSSTSASAIAAICSIIAMGLFLEAKTKASRVYYASKTIINFLPVALVAIFSSWILFIVGFIGIFLFTSNERVRLASRNTGVILGVMVLFGVIFSIPSVKRGLKLPTDYPRELKLGLRESWIITSSSLRDFPFQGSGPSTFFLDFSHYRPLGLNGGNAWNIRFDKAFNEVLEVAATTGIIGLLVFILFAFKAFNLAKYTDTTGTNAAISASIVGILVFFLFSHSYIVLSVVLFMMLGLLTSYIKAIDSNSLAANLLVESAVISFAISGTATNVTTKTVSIVFAIPLMLLSTFGAYVGVRVYAGELFMRRAIASAQANNAQGLLVNQRRAIRFNPYISAYHGSFAQTNFIIANALAGSKKQEELTDQDRRSIQALIASAIQETRVTTELLSPTNAANWEQRGRLYSLLTGVAKDADTWSAGSYTRAIELDPTNPILRVNLGGVYYAAKNFDQAERHFRAAVSLKPDYANAHYNLAQALKANRKFPEAVTEMQIVLRLIPQDSQDYQKANEELTALKALPDVAGATDTKPSVTDLQGGNTQRNNRTTNQQNLSNPDQRQTPSIKEATESLRPAN